MDLELWEQIEPSGRIHASEFFNPERMSAKLVQAIGITRQAIGRPMRMSKAADGRIFHPNGDASDPGDGHAGASLHYFGIDHDESKRTGNLVPDPAEDGLAVDFDFAVADPDFLFELLMKLERVVLPFQPYRWTGIGAYPTWRLGRKANPGFHIDIRSLVHPNFMARWMRDGEGKYVPLDWKTWKRLFEM